MLRRPKNAYIGNLLLHRQLSLNCCKVIFIGSTLLISLTKAFTRVSTQVVYEKIQRTNFAIKRLAVT